MGRYRIAKLNSDQDWALLAGAISPKRQSPAVTQVIGQFRALGAICAVIEHDYLDQDFSASFAAFYSRVFKRHTKHCVRYHFLSVDVENLVDDTKAEQSQKALESIGNSAYLGFLVARPLLHAPLGRAVVVAPKAPDGMITELLVRGEYRVHFLGAEFCFEGIALTQQDSRVGSCAQASMWMASRHFHIKHRGPWKSMVAITEAATKLKDRTTSGSLPAGADYLSPDNMMRALDEMDRVSLFYAATPDQSQPNVLKFSWKGFDPINAIHRYVDSGIPVLLSLYGIPGQQGSIGHAILATGQCRTTLPAIAQLPKRPTTGVFCQYLLAHDDQRGSNLRVPKSAKLAHAETEYNLADHLIAIIVPLPQKVFINAEQAETLAWDVLGRYRNGWEAHKADAGAALGGSVEFGDKFASEFDAGRVIARTYLTFGWRYKARMLRNKISDDFKSALFYQNLPKYVWVTEFGTFESLNHLSSEDQRVFSHCVVDATGSPLWDSYCIFHAPGITVRWNHNPSDPYGEYDIGITNSADDVLYKPKIRGLK